jgi:hypothetical protein
LQHDSTAQLRGRCLRVAHLQMTTVVQAGGGMATHVQRPVVQQQRRRRYCNKDDGPTGLCSPCSRSCALAPDYLDFELPFTSKFLLLAAYVCSRNKASIDRRLFDPSSRAGRRLGAMASDKQVHGRAQMQLEPSMSCDTDLWTCMVAV